MRAHLADVMRNYELNGLVDDLDLPVTPDELRWRGWDREAVHQVFDALEFRILRDRLYQYLDAVEPEAESGFDLAGSVLREGVGAWLTEHAPAGTRVGVAVAGKFGRGTGEVTGVGLAVAGGPAAWFDPTELDAADDAAVGQWLAADDRLKVLHDVKPARLAFGVRGWDLQGVASDTALEAYLARPDQRSYELNDLALRYLKRELRVDTPDNGQLALDGLGGNTGEAEENLMLRARATLDLADAIAEELRRDGDSSARLLAEVELPLVTVLAEMERVGIAADTDYLSELESKFAGDVKAAAQGAYEVIGREFNLGSPKQLQEILFNELGLPKTKRIKTGYTTDAEALQNLHKQTEHPLLAHLLRHRDVAKLKTTVDGLLKSVSDDGRIHTTYYQTVAATGRLSSTDPNLQNIPIRTEEGRQIRRAFVVGEGFETLLTADYSQIEMRIMAHLSKDEALIEAFNSGFDFHAATASAVFSIPVDKVVARPAPQDQGDELRPRLRPVVLRAGLAARHHPRRGHASSWRSTSPRSAGSATTCARSSPRPAATATPRRCWVAAATCRTSTATTGSAARWPSGWPSTRRSRAPPPTSSRSPCSHVDDALRAAGLRSRMLLQVHDELVFEVAPGEHDAMEALVREQMGAAYPLDVPLGVSVGTGRDWNAADH